MEELTAFQRAFVAHYLNCHNGAEAARRAGYSERTAKEQASRLLTNVNIKAAIQAGIREIMPPAEVVQLLADQARGSMRAFVRQAPNGDLWGLDLSEEQPLHLIRKLKITNSTKGDVTTQTIDFELYDAHAALVDIGKMHGLFIDRKEISGPNGGAIEVRAVDYRTNLDALKPDDA